jgi:hypothetical protein
MANMNNAAISPKDQPELTAIYDRLDAVGNSLGILDDRLAGISNRALGSYPEPGQSTGTVKAVADGAVAKVNEQIDRLAYFVERVRETTSRLERLV